MVPNGRKETVTQHMREDKSFQQWQQSYRRVQGGLGQNSFQLTEIELWEFKNFAGSVEFEYFRHDKVYHKYLFIILWL